MAKYNIIAWSGKTQLVLFTGLTYQEAKRKLLKLYNDYYGKERGKVGTYYEACDRDEEFNEGMYGNLQAFNYKGRVLEIVEEGVPSWKP